VRVFVSHGVQKVRLTGGEPLLRRDLERLVERLARIETADGQPLELTLTTNASLLPKKARALRDAGLARLTVSLDALDDAVFRAMNDVDFRWPTCWPHRRGARGRLRPDQGQHGGQAWRQRPRGRGDGAPLPRQRRIVRFIEFMDTGSVNGWRMDDVVPSREVLARIDEAHPIEPLEANYGGEVAQRWRYRDGAGELGVISSVTQAFCRDCTRARLSTEGRLYTCLFAQAGHDLRALLRGGPRRSRDRRCPSPTCGGAARIAIRDPDCAAPRPADRDVQSRMGTHRRSAAAPRVARRRRTRGPDPSSGSRARRVRPSVSPRSTNARARTVRRRDRRARPRRAPRRSPASMR
jgi:hypothetical protein